MRLLQTTIMANFISSSLLALSAVTAVYSTPLSTSPHYIPLTSSNYGQAPLHEEYHPHGSLNNSYIVVFKPDFPTHLIQNHYNFLQSAHHSNPLDSVQSGLRHLWDGNLKGYAGTFSQETIDQVRLLPEVDFVERDQIVRISESETQRGAPWVCSQVPYYLLLCLTNLLGPCAYQSSRQDQPWHLQPLRVRL